MKQIGHQTNRRRRRKLLLTGFAPFGGNDINPSWEVVKRLRGKEIENTRIIGMRLPVVFGQAGELVIKAIKKHQPDFVLMLGLAANISVINLERVGLNIHTGLDERKKAPEQELIIHNGLAAYLVTLPIKGILAQAKAQGVPMNISYHAGTYICNEVLYTTLHYLAGRKSSIKAGFVHLPLLKEQVKAKDGAMAGMSLASQVAGIRFIIEMCLAK